MSREISLLCEISPPISTACWKFRTKFHCTFRDLIWTEFHTHVQLPGHFTQSHTSVRQKYDELRWRVDGNTSFDATLVQKPGSAISCCCGLFSSSSLLLISFWTGVIVNNAAFSSCGSSIKKENIAPPKASVFVTPNKFPAVRSQKGVKHTVSQLSESNPQRMEDEGKRNCALLSKVKFETGDMRNIRF